MTPATTPTDLVRDLAAIPTGDPLVARSAAVPILRGRLDAQRERIEAELLASAGTCEGGHGCGGLEAARALSAITDEAVRALHALALRALPARANAPLAVAAVGGYGRGHMAPHSDVDLLFVVAEKSREGAEVIAQWMLYALWDLRLKVGHATRSPAECVALAREDQTIRTALMEARHLAGGATLTESVIDGTFEDLSNGRAAEFARRKLIEREARLGRVGNTRYRVEPDVKEGKGGQRDLQALYWIAKAVHGVRAADDLLERGVFTADEFAAFRAAEDFQWAVRCHMHFERGRAVERLSFDLQPAVAARMGFAPDEGAAAGEAAGMGTAPVERFMREWFRHSRNVGDLTRILCAQLEEAHVKPAGRGLIEAAAQGVADSVLGAARALRLVGEPLPDHPHFTLRAGRLALAHGMAFAHDPVDLIRLFHIADAHGLDIHPDALAAASRSTELIDDAVRGDAGANRLFVEIVAGGRDAEATLRRMNEAGVLGAFIPAFGRIALLMQFSMYHHFTVDEHLIQTVGVFHDIAGGDPRGLHPLAVKLVPAIADRRALAIACFLHDIAKGRPEDHSLAGAEEARALCPRLGLDERETELVAWLIAEHLTMSTVAQTRDISDARTIRDFGAVVRTRERLDMLLVLTVCDIRAVGPGVWNGWKGQLLRTLHRETAAALDAEAPPAATREREAREALAQGLVNAGWDAAAAARHAALHARPYLLATPLEDQLRQAACVRAAEESEHSFYLSARTLPFEGVTELTVIAADHPRLFAILTGACGAAGGNIAGARIDTMSDGRALDVFHLTRDFDEDADELRRAARIERNIIAMLTGRQRVEAMVGERRARPGVEAFEVTPRVSVTNELSDRHTVIETEGRDRPGLLSEIAGALGALNLDLRSAQTTTFGEKAVSALYVTDLMGGQIASADRLNHIEETVLAALEGREAPARRASNASGIAARA